MPSPNLPLFATSNLTSCEQYLFLDHPTDFVALTSSPSRDHHHTSDQGMQAIPHPAAAEMQRHHSAAPTTSSTSNSSSSSTISPSDAPPTMQEDYLGGGAVRHPFHTHQSPTTQQQHLQSLTNLAAQRTATHLRREACLTCAHLHPEVHFASTQPTTPQRDPRAQVKRREEEEAKAEERRRQEWNRDIMTWWPLPLEVLEREWSEEFYD